MKYYKKNIFLLLVCILCSAVIPCAFADEYRTENAIIEDMILDYGYYQSDASYRINSLLEELSYQNPTTAYRWQQIMERWKYCNTSLEMNYNCLPDGLDCSDRLCIVVLGYELNANGSIKPELEGRLTVALRSANLYPNAYILCTGGGTAAKNPNVTEAEQMAQWLMDHGIEPNRLIIECESSTTGQNAINSYRILRDCYPGIDQVAIVSSDYHLSWGTSLFETKFLMEANEYGEQPIYVVSNAAFYTGITNHYYRYQAAGILELAGLNSAWKVYAGTMKMSGLR